MGDALHQPHMDERSTGRGWPRAAALFAVVMALSVVRPGVLIAVPVLALLTARRGIGGTGFLLGAVAALIAFGGAHDGLWYVERAWAVLVAGVFVGLTLARPGWPLASRALGAVLSSVGASAVFFSLRSGGWSALDWVVADGVTASVTTTLDALALVREGQAVSPAFAATMYEMADAQIAVFPAMVALASMAALGVAWWLVTRMTGGGDQGLGPLGQFRFNDHLVWLMIGGLLLVVVRWGDALARVGANTVVFMSALYALRGAAVVMFVSGGLSLVGYMLFALGLVFAAPVVLGVAVMIGIGDIWLDLRARAPRPAA